MAEDPITRFAYYSDDELARLLSELERGHDDRLLALIAAIRAELERRRLAGGAS